MMGALLFIGGIRFCVSKSILKFFFAVTKHVIFVFPMKKPGQGCVMSTAALMPRFDFFIQFGDCAIST